MSGVDLPAFSIHLQHSSSSAKCLNRTLFVLSETTLSSPNSFSVLRKFSQLTIKWSYLYNSQKIAGHSFPWSVHSTLLFYNRTSPSPPYAGCQTSNHPWPSLPAVLSCFELSKYVSNRFFNFHEQSILKNRFRVAGLSVITELFSSLNLQSIPLSTLTYFIFLS